MSDEVDLFLARRAARAAIGTDYKCIAYVAERVKEAVEAEREACAKIGEVVSDYVARTIRARGKSEAER